MNKKRKGFETERKVSRIRQMTTLNEIFDKNMEISKKCEKMTSFGCCTIIHIF